MNVINEIKTLLGMEVKLAQMKLIDGVTVIEAETFEPEQPVFIVNGEDRVALPVGDYELEDGNMLMVEVEGVIKEVMPMTEEAPEEAAPIEPEVEAQAEAPAAIKKVIESVSKETFFSEIEKLRSEIAELKLSKEVKEVVKEELSVQPLTHSPETKSEIKLTRISPNRPMTTRDRVMAKLFN
jgi:hypothetical protein